MTTGNESESGALVEPAETGRPRLPALARVVLYLVGYVLLQLVLGGIALSVLVGVAGEPPESEEALFAWIMERPGILAGLLWSLLVGVLGLTAFFVRVLDRRSVASLGFAPEPAAGAQIAVGFVLGGALMATVFGVGWLLGWYEVAAVLPPGPAAMVAAAALAFLIPAAAAEEIALRGYVLQTLEARYGWQWALGVSSVVFALFHGLNPNAGGFAIIGITIAGIYLGAAYLFTRRLWLPIAVHTAWNFFEGPVFGFAVSGIRMPATILQTETHGPRLWTGGAFGPEAGLLLALAILAHLALLARAARPFRVIHV